MATPDPIGPLYYDGPRAVKARNPNDVSDIHTVVHAGVSVHVASVLEGHAIIDAWPIMMQAAADKAEEVLAAMREAATT